jgi:L-alanine-DL-glutamate epimerase-like enolase superfamily enzyme
VPDDGPVVRDITAAVYVIPTDLPEADGTLAWDKSTMVIASARAGAAQGLGWTYAAAAAQSVITEVLAGAVVGRSALDVPGAAEAMARAVRNVGRPGVAATAISAVDIALWDLKARLLSSRNCSARRATASLFTEVVALPATTTASSAGSWPAGWKRTASRG